MKLKNASLLAIAIGLVFSGCDEPRASSPAGMVGTAPTPFGADPPLAPEAPPASASLLPPEPPGLQTIDAPHGTACVIESDGANFFIMPAVDGRGLVSRRSAHVKAAFDGRNVVIEAETKDARLHGYGRSFIYPKTPFIVSPRLFAGRRTELVSKGANGGTLNVDVYAYGTSEPKEISCADLTLSDGDESSPRGETLIPGYPTSKPMNVISAAPATPIDLSDEPRGPAFTKLSIPHAVHVLETSGDRSRVAILDWQGAAYVGWLKTSVLTTKPLPTKDPTGVVTLSQVKLDSVNDDEEDSPPVVPPGPRVVCSHEVRLVAISANGRNLWVIGVVKPNIPLAVSDTAPLAKLTRGALDLAVAPDWELSIPTKDLAGCLIH